MQIIYRDDFQVSEFIFSFWLIFNVYKQVELWSKTYASIYPVLISNIAGKTLSFNQDKNHSKKIIFGKKCKRIQKNCIVIIFPILWKVFSILRKKIPIFKNIFQFWATFFQSEFKEHFPNFELLFYLYRSIIQTVTQTSDSALDTQTYNSGFIISNSLWMAICLGTFILQIDHTLF